MLPGYLVHCIQHVFDGTGYVSAEGGRLRDVTLPGLCAQRGGSPDNLQEPGAVLDLVRYVTQLLFQGCGDTETSKQVSSSSSQEGLFLLYTEHNSTPSELSHQGGN